jgi:branched-chain amino acid transport system substrate-binding protein
MIRAPIVLAAVAFAGCRCGPETAETAEKPPEISIGVVAPLTGANAGYGISMRNGVDLAIAELNAKGGIRGRAVRAIHLDDQSRPEEAKAATLQLVTEEKVALIIGEVSSAASLEMAPIAQRAEIPMITPSATDPSITELGDFVFRVCFADPLQAEVMAVFAREVLSIETAAILRDVDSSYSVALATAFRERFERLGGRVVEDQAYGQKDRDYAPVVRALAAAGADAIYVPGYAEQIAELAALIRAAKIEARFLGSDGFDVGRLLAGGAANLEGAHFTTHFSPGEPSEEVKAFAAAYGEVYNEPPDSPAALGYDAARVAFRALAAAGPDDKRELRDAIAATRGFPGVTGAITLDEKRNAQKVVVISTIRGGSRRFVARKAVSAP